MLAREETREKKRLGLGAMTVITMLTVGTVLLGISALMRSAGHSKLQRAVADTGSGLIGIGELVTAPDTGTGAAPEEKKEQILYKGQLYSLNEDMITILLMGIDRETVRTVGGESWSVEEGSALGGGQADALFLLLLNPHERTVSIVAINRNTMADVDVWDADGNYKGVYVEQIALQHGYGDGREESCERQVKAVSRMLHGIAVNSYAAISMDAIPELNDAVGGITVEVLDDVIYPEYGMDLHQGDVVTLSGEKAYWYVRLRNEAIFDSNSLRLQRQKQYLTTFAAKAKAQVSQDIRVAGELYRTLRKYMVTDLDLNSFTYLATEASGYSFDVANLRQIAGETMQGNDFEEFYMDEDALQELIVELFYEPVVLD